MATKPSYLWAAALFVCLGIPSALAQAAASTGVDSSFLLSPSCPAGTAVTALTACLTLSNTYSSCNTYPSTAKASIRSCLCVQPVLNAIADCESEQRLCFGTDDFDADAQEVLSNWHETCDAYLGTSTAALTTPVLSTIPAGASASAASAVGNCDAKIAACNSESVAYEACTSSFGGGRGGSSQEAALSSCLCAPDLIGLQYSCVFQCPVSGTTPALSDIPASALCTNFAAVLSSVTAQASSHQSQTTIGPSSSTPAQPGSSLRTTTGPTSSSPPSPASSSSSSGPAPGGRDVRQMGNVLQGLVAGLVALVL